MATTDKEKEDNIAGNELNNSTDGMQIRVKNRLKVATNNITKILKAVFKPAKKYIIIAGICAVVVSIITVFLAASLWYIKDWFTKQDTDNPENVPGTTKNVMNATTQIDPETGEIKFIYDENDKEEDQDNSSGSNSTIATSLDNFLFIGDSRYAGTADYINNKGNNIKNVGVSSSTIDEWGNVVKNKGKGTVQGKTVDITGTYSGISIQLGANGVYQNVDNTVNSMKTLVTEVQKLYPNVPIFVNSCVQVNQKAKSNGYSWNVTTFRDNVNDFNKAIKEYCNTVDNVYYIDVNTNLNDSNGFLKNEYTEDGVHCNARGGQLFAENIKNAILNTDNSSNNNEEDSDFITMTDSVVISKNDDGEYCIARDLNARVNEIYKILEESESSSLIYFEDEEQAKEALKLWIMAEYSSQYVNLSEDVENYSHDYNADYIQGSIKVRRYSVDYQEGKFLTYKTPEEFEELKSNYESSGATEVFDYFTIDSEDNLVVATYMREDQTCSWTEVEDPKGDKDEEFTKYTVSEQKLNYRNMAREYSIPFNLLWAMVVYGEDVSFANEIAKLVIGSEMVIGIRDNLTTTTTTTVDRYLKEEKIVKIINEVMKAFGATTTIERRIGERSFFEYIIHPSGNSTGSNARQSDYETNPEGNGLNGINESSFYEKTTVNIFRINSVFMELEYIDSWFAKYQITYEAIHEDPTSNTDSVGIENTKYEKIEGVAGDYVNLTDSQEIENYVAGDSNAQSIHAELRTLIRQAIIDEGIEADVLQAGIIPIINEYGSPYTKIFTNRPIAQYICNGYSYTFEDLTQDEVGQDEDLEIIRENCISYYNSLKAQKETLIQNQIKPISLIIDKIRYMRTVNRTITTTTEVDTKRFNKTETKTTEKTNKKIEDEETENFVSIFCKKEYAKAYAGLTGSFSNWFFGAIAKNEDTVGYVDLLKYLLYKATGDDYGVTEYDMSTAKFKVNQSNMKNTGMIRGDTIQAKVWFALKNLGYSDEQVAGVMGNIHWESGGFTTTAVEGNGVGIGLIQWSFGRRTRLEAYAASKGVDWKDEDTQVEFLIAEMTQGGGANGYGIYNFGTYNGYTPDNWYNATTIEEATIAFCWTFERCDILKSHMDERLKWAKYYYDEFHGKTLASFDNSDFLQLAIEIHDYIRINNFYYGNGSAIPVPAGQQYIDCSAYVSWVLYEYGYQELFQNNGNWQYIVSTFRDKQYYLESTYGWVYKDPSQAQPGDLLIYDNWGHIEIYAGGDDQYGAGSTAAIRRVNPNKGNYKNHAIKAITITKPK